MTKHLKKLVSPLVSLIFLLSMTSTGFAETTVSAEVQAICNAVWTTEVKAAWKAKLIADKPTE